MLKKKLQNIRVFSVHAPIRYSDKTGLNESPEIFNPSNLAAKSGKSFQNNTRKSVFWFFSKHPWNTSVLFGGRDGPWLKAANKGRDLDSDRGGAEAVGGLAAFSQLPTALLLWLTALRCQCQAGARQRAEQGWAAGLACLLMTYTKQLQDSPPPLASFRSTLASPAVWHILKIHINLTMRCN